MGNLKTATDVIKQFCQETSDWGSKSDTELSFAEKKQRYNEAQSLLRNKILKAEIKRIIDDTMEEIVFRSQDFSQVLNLRMTINGLNLLIERLEAINNPEREQSFENVDEAI